MPQEDNAPAHDLVGKIVGGSIGSHNCDSDALHIRLVRNCNGKVTGFSDESFRMMGLGSEEITGSQVLAGVEFLAEKLVLENHRASKAVIPFQQELTAMGLLDSTARRSSASRKNGQSGRTVF